MSPNPPFTSFQAGGRWFCPLLLFLCTGFTASARITRSRPSPSSIARVAEEESLLKRHIHSTVVGAGFEYTSDQDVSEITYPLLIEYYIGDSLAFTLEPSYLSIHSKSPDEESVHGWGDLETSLIWVFQEERASWPSLSIESVIKWPVAEHADLGEPGFDYSLGLVADKEFEHFELDLGALYVISGNHDRRDTIELTAAVTWELIDDLDVIQELTAIIPGGNAGADPDGGETEYLLGLSWQATENLLIEPGMIFKDGHEWEAVIAFEWSFASD